MTVLLVVALIAAVVLVIVVLARDVLYRAKHPFSNDDIDAAREDAIKRSQAALSGKVGETFAPFFPWFLARFDPRDAKFLGQPVDLVVFDGMCEDDLREVVLVEVKTGARAQLSTRERQIRKCIEEGRVRFEVFNVTSESSVTEVGEG